MKATTLIAAAALMCGTAAFAQQQDNAATRGETTANGEVAKPADDANRTKNAVKNFGHKTREAMHRAGDKMRHAVNKDKGQDADKHARAERHNRDGDKHARTYGHDRDGDRHARAERHDRRHDTRAMGAPSSDMRDSDAGRRQRMDDAYATWKQKNG